VSSEGKVALDKPIRMRAGTHRLALVGPGGSCEFLIAGEQSGAHGLGECT